jgi:hypothetical protein
MIRDKGKPMFDPDDQWIDREFVGTMMHVYRLSPETLGKMADAKSMAADSEPVRHVGPFRFTFYVTDENRNMFVDVHEPKLGVHLVHADWRNFMVVAQETAKELEEAPDTAVPISFRVEFAKINQEIRRLKDDLKSFADVVANRLGGMASHDVRAIAVAAKGFSQSLAE